MIGEERRIPLGNLNYPDVRKEHRPPRPKKIQFPDGSMEKLDNWRDIMVKTVQWLVVAGHLDKDSCPIKSRRSRYLVHTEPFHSNKRPFGHKEQVGNLYVETQHKYFNFSRRTVWIIDQLQADPACFKLSFLD